MNNRLARWKVPKPAQGCGCLIEEIGSVSVRRCICIEHVNRNHPISAAKSDVPYARDLLQGDSHRRVVKEQCPLWGGRVTGMSGMRLPKII